MTPITTDRLSRPAYDALPAETRAELEAAVPAGARIAVRQYDGFYGRRYAGTLRRGSRIIASAIDAPTPDAVIRRVLAVAGIPV